MRPYLRLFWGFLLWLVDFHVNGFDLLPDIVGILVIVWGLSALKGRNDAFGLAFVIAVIFVVLDVIGFVVSRTGGGYGLLALDDDRIGVGAPLFTLVTLGLQLVLLYGVCKGIAIEAESRAASGLARSAMARFTVLAIATLFPMLVFIFVLAGRGGGFGALAAAAFVAWLVGLVAYILFLTLLLNADRSLDAAPPPSA